jgi:hypothetical protein
MKKLVSVCAAAGFILAVSSLVQATVIVKYGFGKYPYTLAPTEEAANISGSNFAYHGNSTYTSFTTGSGGGSDGAYQADGGDGWNDNDYEDYFYFTVTIAPGWSLDVSSLEFDSDVGSMSGPEYAKVTCDNAVIETDIFIWASGWQYGSYRNIAADFLPTGLTGSVEFHIYAKETEMGYGGSFAVDNVILNGTVSQVPEPATIGILGLGALTLLRRKK